jgi:hypothetical protein
LVPKRQDDLSGFNLSFDTLQEQHIYGAAGEALEAARHRVDLREVLYGGVSMPQRWSGVRRKPRRTKAFAAVGLRRDG